MKAKALVLVSLLALLLPARVVSAADLTPTQQQLKALVENVRAKVKAGQKTQADLADDLNKFDSLLAQHRGEKTDDVAEVLLMKAMLYLEIFDDTAKGKELIQQLKRDYPATAAGESADKILARIQQRLEAEHIQSSLVTGAAFPDFNEKDIEGRPLSLANYKGKVVLVDFWATWCSPCMEELPHVLSAYEKHHRQGFDIVGVSLDKDEAKLKDFTRQMKMTWAQFFDGQMWSNKLAKRYGIQSIPATYLLDGEGKIIGKDLRGDQLETVLNKVLPGHLAKEPNPAAPR